MYNDNNELLAVAKLSKPILKSFSREAIIKIKLDFYAYEDKIKAYLKANIAEQLFSPNVSAQIKGDYDSMLQRVKELDKADIEASQLGAVEMKP